MDDAAWGALALALTVLGGLYTYLAYQRRGITAALRGGAVTLLPVAAWLTGVLELLTEIGGAIGDWALDLALRPTTWLGLALGGLAAVLFVVSGVLGRRGVGQRGVGRRGVGRGEIGQRPPQPGEVQQPGPARSIRRGDGPASPALSGRAAPEPGEPHEPDELDEMAEIEAILRRRGIT